MSYKRTPRVRLIHSRTNSGRILNSRSNSITLLNSRSDSSDKEGSIRSWLNNVREYSGEWERGPTKSPDRISGRSPGRSPGSPAQSHVPSPETLRQKLMDLVAEQQESEAKPKLDIEAEPVNSRVSVNSGEPVNGRVPVNSRGPVNGREPVNSREPVTSRGSNTVTLMLQRNTPVATTAMTGFRAKQEERASIRSSRQGTPRRERTFTRQDLPLAVKVYRQVCRKLRILPLRRVIGQFGRPRIILTDLCLSASDVRATCKGLLHESSATYLDFSGNTIGAAECRQILQMLSSNHLFTQLRLADNQLSGSGIVAVLKYFSLFRVITVLDISGNKLTDREGAVVADIIKVSPQLRVLHAHHNEFREIAGKELGKVIAETCGLEELDLSWNHIRQHGAIGLARGIERNVSLVYINLGWNGFGYEGCVALSDALRHNISLVRLDVTCNRIHPPALMELMKGLFSNKVLKTLILDRNPLTPSFTSILLEGILRHLHTMALQELGLKGVVVDRDFHGLLEGIQEERAFRCEFETSLPVSCKKRDDMMKEVEMRNNYNIEPLRMLYLLKERNRAQDFFHKINKDHNDGLTPDELSMLFKESGLPVSKFIVDRIMQFMDTDGDGKIDLAEFLIGDKKMKKITRDHARTAAEAQYTHYSRTFRKAHIQQMTSRLQVEEIQPQYLSPIASAPQSQASSRRSSLNYP